MAHDHGWLGGVTVTVGNRTLDQNDHGFASRLGHYQVTRLFIPCLCYKAV